MFTCRVDPAVGEELVGWPQSRPNTVRGSAPVLAGRGAAYPACMTLTDSEYRAIVGDESKRIHGDIAWTDDEDHSPSVEFRASVESSIGWPLFVSGSYNPLIDALTFALILKTEGCIYRLDLGKDHHNPTCQMVGEKHKHTWSEAAKTKVAYVPEDITADASDPVAVWEQFLLEAKIDHDGVMHAPPTGVQEELWP